MGSPAVAAFVARALTEEGVRKLPYDDKTGKPVVAPEGNLTWGIGFNLMQCGSLGLFQVMLEYLATNVYEAPLLAYRWYRIAGPARQSVFLDIAYNEGVSGLVNGFPHMLTAAERGDWQAASAECTVADESLDKSRYAPLRTILLNGA